MSALESLRPRPVREARYSGACTSSRTFRWVALTCRGGPALQVGEEVDIALCLPKAVLSRGGIVLRCEEFFGDHSLALGFVRLRSPVVHAIAAAVRQAQMQATR